MAQLSPYLFFAGTCEEAFGLYRDVFGGEFSDINRYGEMPPSEDGPSIDPDKIMHMELPVGDGQVLMGADTAREVSGGVSVLVSVGGEEEGRVAFEKLSAGGEVQMPYGPTFWGAIFGSCIDRYGVHWQVHYAAPAE